MIFSSKFLSMTLLSAAALSAVIGTVSASSLEQETSSKASTTKKPCAKDYDWDFLTESSTRLPDTYKWRFPYLSEDTIKGFLSITNEEVQDYMTDPAKIRYIETITLLSKNKIDEAAQIATEALALGDPRPAREMGNVFFDRDVEKAIFWLTKAHEKENTSATALLAHIRRDEGNLEEAKRLAITAFGDHNLESLDIFASVFQETHPTFSQNCADLYEKIVGETDNIFHTLKHPSPLVSKIFTVKTMENEKARFSTHRQELLREDCPEELVHFKK